MRIKLSVSREEQEQVLGSVLQELQEQEGVEEGWRDTTLVCRDGRLVTNRLLLALLLPAMEVGDQPLVLLPNHTVGEVLGLPGDPPLAPSPAPVPTLAAAPPPSCVAAPAPVPAPTPASSLPKSITHDPISSKNYSPIHDFTSDPHLPVVNTLPANDLKQPDNNYVEGFVSSYVKRKPILKRPKKNHGKKTIGAQKDTPVVKESLASKISTESVEDGVDEFLSKSLEKFELAVKVDLKSEQVVYGESDTEEEEEEKPQRKTRGKNRIKKTYICDLCTLASTTKDSLIRHRRRHTGEKPFGCTLCEKHFTTPSSRNIHQNVHTGEMTVFCEDCGKRFSNNHVLKKHMRKVHGKKTEEKPGCTLCNKQFRKSRNLEKHMLLHTGEKPHGCTKCKKAFAAVESLKRHNMSHTGEKPFPCTTCEKAFSELSKLKRHKLIHTKSI